jgi:hypothetical protein
MLFIFEEELKRARQADALKLHDDALQLSAGKWPAQRSHELTRSAAVGLSRLTERRVGTLQASELQAAARWSRLANVLLLVQSQLQLSCPHLHHAVPHPPTTPRHLPDVLITRRFLYLSGRFANGGRTIRATKYIAD